MASDFADRGAFLAATVTEAVDEMSTALGEPAGGEELLECSRVDLQVGQAVQLRAPVRSHLTGGDGREPEVEVVR